jgi:hypothetical protein
MITWYFKHENRIIDVFTPVLAILFTLWVEGKFNEIPEIKAHPVNMMIGLSVLTIILAWRKISYEVRQDDFKEKLQTSTEENEYLKQLISAFKYQISQPLEDKLFEIYESLRLDNQYRITVYTYTKGRFFSIARYAKNQHYKKFGRIAIGDRNELLFKAWEDGELNEAVSPDSNRKMPSCKIAIKYLYEKNDINPQKDKIGVIVFETTNHRDSKLNNGKLKETVKIINDFMNESWNIKQDLNFAISEGV